MYELLGLVKDGKAPKKIKYEYSIYELTPERNDYYCKGLGQTQPLSEAYEKYKQIKAKRKLVNDLNY